MAEENVEQVEKSARTLGWVPIDEFRGDPDKWIEADQFVERGTSQLPILRENIDRLMKKFDKSTSEVTSLKADIQAMGDYNRKADERAYKTAEKEYKTRISDLKKQIKQAAKDGEDADIEAIEVEIDALEKPVELPKKDVVAEPQNQDPAFPDWQDENKWYGKDVERSAYADSIAPYISKTNPGLTGKPWFDKITEEVQTRFPDKFENKNRKKAAPVDGGDDPAPTKKGGKKYADLPDADKEVCNRVVSASKSWSKPLTREEWLEEYNWEE